MLIMSDILFQQGRDAEGVAIAFVIGDEVAETLPVVKWFGDLVLSSPIYSSERIDDKEVVVITTDSETHTLDATDKLTAVLLSEPTAVQITKQYRAVEPGWSYKDGKFFKTP